MFWLKEAAWLNIRFMSVTDETSQEPMFWLKEAANQNMEDMSVTDETSH